MISTARVPVRPGKCVPPHGVSRLSTLQAVEEQLEHYGFESTTPTQTF